MSVILLTGGGLVPGRCLLGGGAWFWGGLVRGCLLGGGACSERVLVQGWVFGPGGCVWSGGVPGRDPPQTATAVGGTHPTGMHSCFKVDAKFFNNRTYPVLGEAEYERECRVEFDVHDAHEVSVHHRHGFTCHVRIPHPDAVISTSGHQCIQCLTVVKTLDTLKR